MIVEWLLDWIQAAFAGALGVLPTDSTNVWANVNMIAANLGSLNYFLPIAETVAVVVAVMFLFPIFMGVSLGLWLLAQLRGSSSVG